MEGALERRAFEFRAEDDGQVLAGVAMPYGSRGAVGRFTESFTPGGLQFAPSGVLLNVLHVSDRLLARYPDGGLELTDSEEALRARVALPDTTEGRDCRELVKAGVLRGFSIEFRAIRDSWTGTHRTVEEAILSGIGIVASPAYAGAVISDGREMRSEDFLLLRSADKRVRRWRSL